MAHFTLGRTAWPVALGAAAMLLVSAPASAEPIDATPVPPAPDTVVAIQSGSAAPAPDPAIAVPHLSSPENLPPGTTEMPTQQGPRLTYWRELWHAYQTQEVSGGDALLLLTQRPMNASQAPPQGMPAGPQPAAPAAEAPAAPPLAEVPAPPDPVPAPGAPAPLLPPAP